MWAFEDNPFAEDDGEPTPPVSSTTRKRPRENDGGDMKASDTSAVPLFDTRQGQQQEEKLEQTVERVRSAENDVARLISVTESAGHNDQVEAADMMAVPVSALLAEYDAGLEEDEYNALVVKAATLESEMGKRNEEHSAELSASSRDRQSLWESVELLRATVLRVRQEMELCRRTKKAVDKDYSGVSVVQDNEGALTGQTRAIKENIDSIQHLVDAFVESSACRMEELLVAKDTAEQIQSRIVGSLCELPQLSASDLQRERAYAAACEAAASKLDTEGPLGVSVSVIQALVSELSLQLQKCEGVFTAAEQLKSRAIDIISSLHELERVSLEWYHRSRVRGSDGSFPFSSCESRSFTPEIHSADLDVKQINATLRHLDSTLNQLQGLPHVVSLSHQNAPSVSAAAVACLCRELEGEAEQLGLEVLRLRRLFKADVGALTSGVDASQGSSNTDKEGATSCEKVKWLVMLSQRLLKQTSSAAGLLKTLHDFAVDNESPLVKLQIMFHQRYSEVQEAFLRSLTYLNGVLQKRATIVENIRQVALLEGDDEAFALCAQQQFQETKESVEGVKDEMGATVRRCLQQLTEESSTALDGLMVRNQQNVQRLLEVRRFLVRVVESTDQLAYGETSEGLRRALNDAVEQQRRLTACGDGSQSDAFPEVSITSCVGGFGDVLEVSANGHKEELGEEMRFIRKRNEELLKRRKWLSMQPSPKGILELLAVQKEIKAVKEKLSHAAQRQARWATAKEALDAKRRQVAEVQAAISEKQLRLRELQQKLQPTGPFGSW